ncbi:MAG: biotin--[acetyl-CoA-carboxylase] ligase [Tidjanibacter sp.]|nr:biotin--[acetyl-CoA-carboxylase] ligase [Tidjanibacter sp.]
MNIIHFDTLPSTNTEAKDARYVGGDVIVADSQTLGRGQRGHTWSSRAGENLTASFVVIPSQLSVDCQFLLSQTAALAVVDTLRGYGIESRVKWTNDIYCGDKKICGILIENTLSGNKVSRSIIGIGVNINQCDFDPDLPNPTSMRLQDGCQRNVGEVLTALCDAVEQRLAMAAAEPERLSADYNSLLYRRGENYRYRLPEGGYLDGEICSVGSDGRLVLDTEAGRRSFAFKEIEFIIG